MLPNSHPIRRALAWLDELVHGGGWHDTGYEGGAHAQAMRDWQRHFAQPSTVSVYSSPPDPRGVSPAPARPAENTAPPTFSRHRNSNVIALAREDE